MKRLSHVPLEARRDVTIVHKDGLHTRPVMQFVDLASTFRARVTVMNITRGDEPVDGKSAMQMMLLEATQGCVLRIQAVGPDAPEAVDALATLIIASADVDALPPSQESSP